MPERLFERARLLRADTQPRAVAQDQQDTLCTADRERERAIAVTPKAPAP
jgi:hypothetical protein